MTVLQYTLHPAIERLAEGKPPCYVFLEPTTIPTTEWTLQPDFDNPARTVLITAKPDLGKDKSLVAYGAVPWGTDHVKLTLPVPQEAVAKYLTYHLGQKEPLIDLTDARHKEIVYKFGRPFRSDSALTYSRSPLDKQLA